MEPEEEIYVNLEELKLPKHGENCWSDLRPPAEPGTRDSPAERGTRTGSGFKAAALGLGLLSFLLLMLVVAVSALYQRDFSQLSRELANQTAERSQLLMMHQNLTDERDRLDVRLKTAELQLDRISRDSVTCPAGWKKSGCSCYRLSSSRTTWESSRSQCLRSAADLVIINDQEEMDFLNQLGVGLKFWIGLKQAPWETAWKWTDGSSPGTTYWQRRQSSSGTQSCAAFNSFYSWNSRSSWTKEICSQRLQSVCEKKASTSG